MFALQNDDEMVSCPYDETHRMLRKRLQTHLIKCRTFHKDVELRKCPFNNTHLIREREFTCHVSTCEDRKLIIGYATNASKECEPKHEPIQTDENWDDTDVEDYDPKKYLASVEVLQMPEGITPSQRKAFRTSQSIKQHHKEYINKTHDPSPLALKRSKMSHETSDDSFRKPPPPPIITNWPKATSSKNSTS